MTDIKQSNLTEIIQSEHDLLVKAPETYGEFFAHSLESYKLLQSFVLKIKDEGWLFVAFLSHLKKHHLLGLLSTVRGHHVQFVMNLRQVIESGTNASYALGNPKPEDFALSTPEGILEIPEKLRKKRYKWLEKNYPKGSRAIESMKKLMQKPSHSNIIDAHRTFKYEMKNKTTQLKTPFFDFQNDFQVKSNLWSLANMAMGLMDLFYGINLKYKIITFSPNFIKDLQLLEKENKKLKKIIMDTPKFKRADKISIAIEKRKP
jgi:hypothetical protein